MARISLTIGEAGQSFLNLGWTLNPGILIGNAGSTPLFANQSVAYYLVRMDLSNERGLPSRLTLSTSSDANEGDTAGPELNTDWEGNDDAIWITLAGTTYKFGGPNSGLTGDSTEPYVWTMGSTDSATLERLRTAYRSASSAQRRAITLALDDGAGLTDAVAPAPAITAIPDGDEGTGIRLAATLAGGNYDSLTYAWETTGGTFDSATVATPFLTRPLVTMDTTYRVDLTVTANGTGGNAAADSSDVSARVSQTFKVVDVPTPLPVADAPVISIQADEGSDPTIWELSVTEIGGVFDTRTYAWTITGGVIDDATIAEPTVTLEANYAEFTAAVEIVYEGDGTTARTNTQETVTQSKTFNPAANTVVINSSPAVTGSVIPIPRMQSAPDDYDRDEEDQFRFFLEQTLRELSSIRASDFITIAESAPDAVPKAGLGSVWYHVDSGRLVQQYVWAGESWLGI